jgi:hypothetical protein
MSRRRAEKRDDARMPVSYSPRPLLRSEIAGGGNGSALDTSVLNGNVGMLEAFGFARKDDLDAVTDKLDAVTDNLILALDEIAKVESRVKDMQDGREQVALDHANIMLRNRDIDPLLATFAKRLEIKRLLARKEAEQKKIIYALTKDLTDVFNEKMADLKGEFETVKAFTQELTTRLEANEQEMLTETHIAESAIRSLKAEVKALREEVL